MPPTYTALNGQEINTTFGFFLPTSDYGYATTRCRKVVLNVNSKRLMCGSSARRSATRRTAKTGLSFSERGSLLLLPRRGGARYRGGSFILTEKLLVRYRIQPYPNISRIFHLISPLPKSSYQEKYFLIVSSPWARMGSCSISS